MEEEITREDWSFNKHNWIVTHCPDFWERFLQYKEGLALEKFSFGVCCVSKGRTYDIEKTLSENLKLIKPLDYVKFYLLGYRCGDGLADFVKNNFMEFIESGKLVFYECLEIPKFFSNTHSRNIIWKLCDSEIVTNLDGDAILKPSKFDLMRNFFTQCQDRRVVLIQSHGKILGYIAMFKDLFVNELGGFDEDLMDYSPWDRDLYNRCLCLGFKVAHIGQFAKKIYNDEIEMVKNYLNKNRKVTMKIGLAMSYCKMNLGIFNRGINRHWGKAVVIKNFDERNQIRI